MPTTTSFHASDARGLGGPQQERPSRRRWRPTAWLAGAALVASTAGAGFGIGAAGAAADVIQVPPPPERTCDFDDDGWEDLVVGAPERDAGGMFDAGAAFVYYGAQSLPNASGAQMIHAGQLTGDFLPGGSFAHTFACGDVNGDGHDDLIVGSPRSHIDGETAAGAIRVVFGSASGLRADDTAQLISQDTPGIQNQAEAHDRFGYSVTSGDFDGDGYDDVAVGAVGEDTGAGAVHVIFGSANGLTIIGDRYIGQWSASTPGTAENDDLFGLSLAAGDFNGDGRDDLAVGAPGEAIGPLAGAGVIHVFEGTANSIDIGGEVWHQNTPHVPGGVEMFDLFGFSLAAGDIDNDGRDDLAIGTPGEALGATEQAGAVVVLYGTGSGLSAINSQAFTQNTPGVPGVAEEGDVFGLSVMIGDLDSDANDELVVGSPHEAIGSLQAAGMVHVFRSNGDALTTTDMLSYTQNALPQSDGPEAYDRFGQSLTITHITSGRSRMVIGAPGENIGGGGGGSVHLVYVAEAGTPWTSALFSEADLPEGLQESDFGESLGR